MLHLFFLVFVFGTALSDLTATLRNTPDTTTLSLEIKNAKAFPVAILRWDTPLDQRFGGNTFRVYFEDKLVPYIGAVVKYAEPNVYDYVILNTNESITVPVVMHNLYDFSKIGTYKIQFQGYIADYVLPLDFAKIPRKRVNFLASSLITSNGVMITTNTPYSQQKRAPYPCSGSETAIQYDAEESLVAMIARAQTVINGGNSPSYQEWFGTFTNARWSIAEEVIRYIRTNNVINYACDDMANVYAYVYPTDTSHTIYCCSVFWISDKIGGFDTQAGTLLHELSHFNNIGGTGDHAYGTTACRNLAISNPNSAVNNADSYEYFGETQFP